MQADAPMASDRRARAEPVAISSRIESSTRSVFAPTPPLTSPAPDGDGTDGWPKVRWRAGRMNSRQSISLAGTALASSPSPASLITLAPFFALSWQFRVLDRVEDRLLNAAPGSRARVTPPRHQSAAPVSRSHHEWLTVVPAHGLSFGLIRLSPKLFAGACWIIVCAGRERWAPLANGAPGRGAHLRLVGAPERTPVLARCHTDRLSEVMP